MSATIPRLTGALLAAVVVAATLTACGLSTQTERYEQWSGELEARILAEVPLVEDVSVSDDPGATDVNVYLQYGDLVDDAGAAKGIGEATLDVARLVSASPLGSLPVNILVSESLFNEGARWGGFDPEHADRYVAATELWLELNRNELVDNQAIPSVVINRNYVLVRLLPDSGEILPELLKVYPRLSKSRGTPDVCGRPLSPRHPVSPCSTPCRSATACSPPSG